MAAITIPEEQALPLCEIAKTATPLEAWGNGEKPGALKMSFGVVCTPPRRGFIIEIYINRGHKVFRRTMNFGLWDLSPGVWTRIFQLTVADSRSPTHTELGVTWFGSHQHIGNVAARLNHLDEVSFSDALELFCKTINLKLDEHIPDPFVFELKN